METILERQRNAHETIERLEQAISDRLLAKPKTVRDRLQLDHEIAEMLETIEVRSHNLQELYTDDDGARAREISNLSAADGLDAFYNQLASVKDYHRRYPDNIVEDLAAQYALRLPDETAPLDPEDRIAKMFSGEETFGRYLNLIPLHSEFINLKRNRTIAYSKYLEIFDVFDGTAFPAYVKDDPRYVQYLHHLLDYLQSFHRRTLPLEDHAAFVKDVHAQFEKAHSSGVVKDADVDKPDGIWCDICQKMYSKQTVYDGHLNSKKHKAGMKSGPQNTSSPTHPDPHGRPAPSTTPPTASTALHGKKEIALLEFSISRYGHKFSAIKAATRDNVARKQTLTDREWQAEQQESHLLRLPIGKTNGTSSTAAHAGGPDDRNANEDDEDDDDKEDDGKIYNPLNLPLDHSGKPIPFWLYRLHGLGNEFPCEICGGHVYKGRKAFDKHFRDVKHMQGLTFLGIPATGTPLYDGVTSIKDAQALFEKAQLESRMAEKRRDENVEMEDDKGNVMNAKVWHDLVAQGIL